ncbi:MAG: TetR/AcrR family transcriptional regulator [Actinobacteria bacterium]|nr:TetR/AcrR family transcriptional regulator [Actinomycetota bacterium]
MTSGSTDRDRAKADRHASLLREAARLFAERGFSGVSLEDLGAAVGVGGPAVYRHFANKQALLGAILVGVSRRLLEGGRAVVAAEADPPSQLAALVRFHADFALADADVIRVHDRDLASLGDSERHLVRRLQHEYVDVWVAVLKELHPDRSGADLRVRAHACFGLMNSTPYSVRDTNDHTVRAILQSMSLAALTA